MSALVKSPRGWGPFTVPASSETDVLLDQPGTVGEQEEEGQVIKTRADGQRGAPSQRRREDEEVMESASMFYSSVYY